MKQYLPPRAIKLFAIVFVSAIFSLGCSSAYSVRSIAEPGAHTYQQMNEKLKGRHATIILNDGKKVSASQIKISDVFVSWHDRKSDMDSTAGIEQVNSIVMTNHLLGGLEGLAFSVIAGGGVGAAWGLVLTSGSEWRYFGALYLGLIGGLVGAPIGLIYGLIEGHSYQYEISPPGQRLGKRHITGGTTTLTHLQYRR